MERKALSTVICLILCITYIEAQYEVRIDCSTSPCTINGTRCNTCAYLNGGPFKNVAPSCADNNTDLLAQCGTFVKFSCSSSCGVGTGHFDTTSPLGTFSGCMTSSDTTWNCPVEFCTTPGVQQYLNFIYFDYTNRKYTPYDWNQGACWVSGGAIAGIVIGGVVLIAIIVVGIICWRRKRQQKREEQALLRT